MEDAENAFNDGIAKMQEALEMVKENCNDVFGLKEEIEELETQAGELEGAGDEINEELKVKLLMMSDKRIQESLFTYNCHDWDQSKDWSIIPNKKNCTFKA